MVSMPPAKNLPVVDAALLEEVKLLGHYPRSLNATSFDGAGNERKQEHYLHKRLKRRKASMDSQVQGFLNAVQKLGSVESAVALREKGNSIGISSREYLVSILAFTGVGNSSN